MRSRFIKTIFIFCLIFSVFGFPRKGYSLDLGGGFSLNPLDLANAIWDVFQEVGSDATSEVLDGLGGKATEDFEDLDTLQSREALKKAVGNRVRNMALSFASTTNPGGVTNTNERYQVITNDIVNQIISNLDNTGIFDGNLIPFSRDEFRDFISNIYLNDVFTNIPDIAFGDYYNDGNIQSGVGNDGYGGSLDQNLVQVTMKPLYPKPGDLVDISVKDLGGNENNSFIEWSKDGQILLSGIGSKTLSQHQINRRGLPETIRIFIKRQDNSIVQTDFRITPAEIDLVYETYTKTPPFYKGKTDVTFESLVKIVAIPHILSPFGNRINGNDLNYRWKINGDVISEYSGRGLNEVYYKIPMTDNEVEVVVDVETFDGEFKAQEIMNINLNSPEVLTYQDHPTLGIIYENEMRDLINLDQDELVIKAFPFFFNKDSSLDFNWFLNYERLPIANSDTVTIGNSNTESGVSYFSVNVSNRNSVLQNGSKNFDIIFNE
jgi:hypothetical protein